VTKHEQERLAVVETKMDNLAEDISEIKENTKDVKGLCARVDMVEKSIKKNEDEHKSFLSKNGFITASIILGILLTIFTILQWIRG
jgi:hypothetical protein